LCVCVWVWVCVCVWRCVWVSVCVWGGVREWVRASVCVWEWARVCIWVWESERVSACVCVCECEWESERVCVCVSVWECVSVSERERGGRRRDLETKIIRQPTPELGCYGTGNLKSNSLYSRFSSCLYINSRNEGYLGIKCLVVHAEWI